jgi:hypothetical protein
MSEKQERAPIEYGHRTNGTIRFGHLHLGSEGELKSDVKSGVMLQAFDSRHYMTMDNDGVRTGWTLNRCPGVYSIKCATDSAGMVDSDDGVGFFLLAEKGDIVIRAPKGRIRLSAQDIDLRADGVDNTRGTINLDSDQSVNVDTLVFDVKATSGIRLFTPFTLDLVGNTMISFTSNFIRGLTAACTFKPDKLNPTTIVKRPLKNMYGII